MFNVAKVLLVPIIKLLLSEMIQIPNKESNSIELVLWTADYTLITFYEICSQGCFIHQL